VAVPFDRVSIREPDAEARVRDYLVGQGYVLTARNGQRGCDIVAERAGRRLRVEVKADRPGHVTSSGTIYVDTCTLLGQIVLRMGQRLADDYAIAIRPVPA
jgi:predicted RecB family endonuclease